ncbi:MAG TPA: hypothetical protein VH641_00810 [Streptosporangiaceae bacterium]|jgi:hypothetical protein
MPDEGQQEGQQQDGGQTDGTGSGGSDGGSRTFTQAELDDMIERRLARERAKYADYGDLQAKAAEYDKHVEASRTEQEKAVAAARGEGKAEAQAAANDRLLRAEIRAAAAGKLADPGDAVRLLDLSQFTVGEDGEIDGNAIEAAIGQLVKDKPYLAADAKRFQGTGDGGPREPANSPKQVTQTEFDAMTPDQRVQARKEGRLTQLLGGG